MSSQLEVKLALAWGMSLVTRFKEADVLLAQVEAGTNELAGSDLWWRCRAARAVYCALRDDAAHGRDLALECLAGHRFDAFNFNALCNVARYAYLKAGDWDAFYAVSKPDASAGEASYVLPENYRLCLYGLAAVKQLRFEEALEFYAAARALAERHASAGSASASMVTGLIARLQYERGDVTGRGSHGPRRFGSDRDHGLPRSLPQRLLRAGARGRRPRRPGQGHQPAQPRRTAELGAGLGRGHCHVAGGAHARAARRGQYRRGPRLAAGIRGATRQASRRRLLLEHADPHLEHGRQGPDRRRFGEFSRRPRRR